VQRGHRENPQRKTDPANPVQREAPTGARRILVPPASRASGPGKGPRPGGKGVGKIPPRATSPLPRGTTHPGPPPGRKPPTPHPGATLQDPAKVKGARKARVLPLPAAS